MGDDRKPDKAIEGLLAHRRVWSVKPQDSRECPDAEVLAAFYDRSLREDEFRSVELHASSCFHCQEHLVLLAKSEPVATAAQEKAAGISWLWNWRWLAPIATVSAVAIVWIAIQTRQPDILAIRTTETPQAKVESPATQKAKPAASEPAQAADAVTHVPSRTELGAKVESKEGKLVGAYAQRAAGKDENAALIGRAASAPPQNVIANEPANAIPSERDRANALNAAARSNVAPNVANVVTNAPVAAEAPAEEKSARAQQAVSGERREAAKQDYANVNRQVAPSADPSQAAKSQEAFKEVESKQKVAQAVETQKRPAEGALTESKFRSGVAASTPAVPKQAEPRKDADLLDLKKEESGKGTGAARRRDSEFIIVASPGREVLWRFSKGGSIDVSDDGGNTWNSQISPVDVDLLAGSAPSRKVCWAVGRGGIVLLNTGGIHWQKVSSPTSEDLTGVSAKDAQMVTVTTCSGIRFLTQDSGRTWKKE
jgi:hypothetical protein